MQVFEVIAQPKRREILRLLAAGELSAGEVASQFAVTQPAISQHIKVLREAGLVSERRDAQRRLLSLRPEGFADLHAFLAEVLPAGLQRLKLAAEEEERSGGARDASRN
jgi:DNA-binding transcriptional ArsR family regulator